MLLDSGTVEILPVVQSLKGFGQGIEHLAGHWRRLRRSLTERGFLCPDEANMGVRLLGVLPRLEALARHEDGYLFLLWSLTSNPVSARKDNFDSLLAPENRPPGLRDVPAQEFLYDPATCVRELIGWIDAELASLAATAERVWVEVDAPARARVLAPGAIILDPEEQKRFDRGYKHYQSTLYKAQNGLEALRRRRAAQKPDAPRPAAGPTDRSSSDRCTGNAAAATPPAADMNPRKYDGESDSGPAGAPEAVTQVVAARESELITLAGKCGLQNDVEPGPEGAVSAPPAPRQSSHKTARPARRPGSAGRSRLRPNHPFRSPSEHHDDPPCC
jgi:hypothetical protein